MPPSTKKNASALTAAPAQEVPKTKSVKGTPKEPVIVPVTVSDVVAPAPASDVVHEMPSVVEVSPLSILEEKIVALVSAMKDVSAQLRLVKKEHDALRRVAERVEKKRANARTTPNGFAKPTKISDELCEFLKVPAGSEKSRTDVTREIHKYIKTNSLFNADNKRIILADPVLAKLLSLKDGVEVTYFNLQSFLKHHFIKSPSPAVVV